jgi:hypothetical protein
MTPLEAFRNEFFGEIDQYMAWHDGYSANTSVLDLLNDSEKSIAETELTEALQFKNADPRAVIGLGHLKSERALPLLNRLACISAYGYYAIQAIANTNPQSLDADLICQALKSGNYTLVMGLGYFFEREYIPKKVLDGLFEALSHSDYLMRYHTLDTLAKFCKVPEKIKNSVFKLIVSDDMPANYRQAIDILKKHAVNS